MDVVATKLYRWERRPLRHLDPVLLISVLALGIVGLITIYSATHASLVAQRIDPGFFLKKQLAFVTLGIVVILVTASFDYRFVKVYAGIVYVASLALLVLVRTPLGTTIRGSQRWFQLFGFQLAPSELAKLALVAMLAAFLS